ncbi:spore germination protein GerPE [Bacillus shivajii]|uniref:spore germination protein GerPE n=1 Tax=Bacillus shivajii TaxID=1983719 RepID=UPI001CFBF0E8|nr:spore germination protein GerPE [Bacillus shivajii]UCZ51456.1 spore germination protein GerPE [Bacillus shivajii]
MEKRMSIVHNLNVIDVTSSSILQIGDAKFITPFSRAIAVQREIETFYGAEGNFDLFPIFKMEIPQPSVVESINIQRKNETPFIKVRSIHITSVAASSVCQIGSNRLIDAESRVKHIRQLLGEERNIQTAQEK